MANPVLDVDWPTVKNAFIAGATLEELSRTTGVKFGTLSARSSRENWLDLRPENLAKRRAELVEKTTKAVADVWANRIEEHRDDWHGITSKQRKRLARMDEDEVAKSLDVMKTVFDIERKNLGIERVETQQQAVVLNLMSSAEAPDELTVEGDFEPMSSPEPTDSSVE